MIRYNRFLLTHMPWFVFLVMGSACVLKLGMMQLDGMPQIGAGLVTFLFAFSSLLYGRARAGVGKPEIALKAADQSLQACVIGAVGISLTSWVFLVLSESYLPFHGNPFKPSPGADPPILPLLCGATSLVFFGMPVFLKLKSAVDLTFESMAASNSI